MKRTGDMEEIHQDYRESLLAKRHEMMRALGFRAEAPPVAGLAEDDRAAVTHDEFVAARVNRMDYSQLRMVEEALDRLDSGDYGICLECEEPIAPKRLQALSWARYCVKCQEAMNEELAAL
jgi:DnaK suppressor protein